MKNKFLILIFGLLLTGCSLVSDPEGQCPDPDASDEIALSFRMISSNIGESRADEYNHHEDDSDVPAIEDLINVKDFAFYIFLANNENKPEPLVMKVTNISASTNPVQMITGSYGAYTVTTMIPKKNLEDILGYKLSQNTTKPVVFKVVALANLNSGVAEPMVKYDDLAPYDIVSAPADKKEATSFSEFMDNANALSVNMNNIYQSNSGDSSYQDIFKVPFPMFGLISFSTTEDMLYKSRPEDRIYMGDIYMLRSVAKIRVIDNADKNDAGYPYISSVSVRGATDMIRPLPSNASSYRNGMQVHTINTMSSSGPDANTSFGLGYFNGDGKIKGTTRVGYLPEQKIDGEGPIIIITAQLEEGRTETYMVPMANGVGSEYSTVNFGTEIVRNHVYTLSINNIATGVLADINLKVEEWTLHELDLNYTETVTVSPRIEWITGTFTNINEETGEVYVRPWSGENAVLLECTFKIRTPENARWIAYLIPKEGQATGAFAFTNEAGDYLSEDESISTSVSGIVSKSGDNTTLYIKPTIQNPTELNSAILQVVVTLGNGTTIEVPLTPSNRDYKNFTIVQNPQ